MMAIQIYFLKAKDVLDQIVTLSVDALIDWLQSNMGRSRDILVPFVLSRSTIYT